MTAGRPRAPLAKLKASGTFDGNARRYRDRKEPQSQPLGKMAELRQTLKTRPRRSAHRVYGAGRDLAGAPGAEAGGAR